MVRAQIREPTHYMGGGGHGRRQKDTVRMHREVRACDDDIPRRKLPRIFVELAGAGTRRIPQELGRGTSPGVRANDGVGPRRDMRAGIPEPPVRRPGHQHSTRSSTPRPPPGRGQDGLTTGTPDMHRAGHRPATTTTTFRGLVPSFGILLVHLPGTTQDRVQAGRDGSRSMRIGPTNGVPPVRDEGRHDGYWRNAGAGVSGRTRIYNTYPHTHTAQPRPGNERPVPVASDGSHADHGTQQHGVPMQTAGL